MSDAASGTPLSEVRYKGIPASPGVAIGPVLPLFPHEHVVRRRKIKQEDIPGEIARLEEALIKTRHQIQEIKTHLSSSLGEKDASIFDAHLLVVEDNTLLEAVKTQLYKRLLCVEFIYYTLTKSYARKMMELDDAYLQERANDIIDVSRRVLRNLMGHQTGSAADGMETPSVILAHDLTPSDTVALNRKNVLGFATEAGSRTSHTTIMARSLNIPAVVGLRVLLNSIESGTEVLLDGHEGLFIVNPSEQTKFEYGQIEIRRHAVEEKLDQLRETVAVTTDQRRIIVSANVELPEDLPLVIENGAEGIGLYRTEFLYLNRDDIPNEDEQASVYHQVAQAVMPSSVIIRTLDVGGDKILKTAVAEQELNPFLGWRGIRFCLDRPDIFKPQLRAICRASADTNIRIMFPMVTDIQEVRRAKQIFNEVREELRNEGIPQAEKIEVGIMVEVPATAVMAEVFAKEVDFFSIGTNDLIQYTMAVDRSNEKVSSLYQPTHPSIIRLLQKIVEGAHQNNIWVGLCGEMASDLVLIPMLVGLGIDELSLGSVFVPRIKRVIQSLSYQEMQGLVQQLISNPSAEENIRVLEDLAKRLYPELL